MVSEISCSEFNIGSEIWKASEHNFNTKCSRSITAPKSLRKLAPMIPSTGTGNESCTT